jgi:hypothetical protein
MPQEARFETRALNPQVALMARVIELQILFNNFQMSIKAQGKILKILFRSLIEQPHSTKVGLFDYKHLSLGRLLSLAGPNWSGDLGGFQMPTSWKQLQSFYKGFDMWETQKWHLCIGDKNAGHFPIVTKPHDENHIELKLDCVCVPKRLVKHKPNFLACCQKCPMCFTMRKYVLSFEFMPLAIIITNMCLS